MFTLASVIACMPRGPVVDTGARPPAVGGTISGTVQSDASGTPLSGRKVTAVDVSSGSRYDVSTASNGGYTLQVPVGSYRLEIELRAGETIAKRPDDVKINNGDLDAARNFVIAIR